LTEEPENDEPEPPADEPVPPEVPDDWLDQKPFDPAGR
jgi:hypothetical protein